MGVESDPLVVDLECISAFDLLSDYQRGRLEILHEKAMAKDSSITEDVENTCALQAATGRIIVIGLLNPVQNRGEVLFDGDVCQKGTPDESGITWSTGSERQILQRFWKLVQGRQIITFNGMSFDAPYLVARSLYTGVWPTQRINPRWYERRVHMDLREELSVFGKQKAYSLEFTCELFGIQSPKILMSGADVGAYYRAGRIREIADYCINYDCRSTAELWRRLAPVLPDWTK